jgi:hypothetical protein
MERRFHADLVVANLPLIIGLDQQVTYLANYRSEVREDLALLITLFDLFDEPFRIAGGVDASQIRSKKDNQGPKVISGIPDQLAPS